MSNALTENQNLDPTVLNAKAVSEIANVLELLEKDGGVKVSDLFPSLNRTMTNAKVGGHPGMIFAGELRKFTKDMPIPSAFEDEDGPNAGKVPTDVAELKDLTQDYKGTVFNFYASNGGLQAKMRGVEGYKFILIMYKGQVESGTRGFNPWRDYIILGGNDKGVILAAYDALKKASGAK